MGAQRRTRSGNTVLTKTRASTTRKAGDSRLFYQPPVLLGDDEWPPPSSHFTSATEMTREIVSAMKHQVCNQNAPLIKAGQWWD